MAQFVQDTFNEAGSNVTLPSHTGETGATWAINSAYSGSSATLQVSASADNLAQENSNGTIAYYASGTPAGVEYDVEMDITYNATPTADMAGMGVAGRMSTTADTMYFARYNPVVGDWQLYVVSAASYTLLGSYTQSLSASTVYNLRLEITDATKKLYVDDVERISSSNNDVTAAGKAGIRWSSNLGNEYNARADNFSADDITAGGSNLMLFRRHW